MVDIELVEWLHPEDNDQGLKVSVNIRDKCCPSGFYTGTINDTGNDKVIHHSLSKIADDTKLSETVNALEASRREWESPRSGPREIPWSLTGPSARGCT